MLLFFVIPASLIFFSPPPESHANFFTSRLVFFLYGRHRKWQRMATLQPTAPYPTRFYRGEGNAPGGWVRLHGRRGGGKRVGIRFSAHHSACFPGTALSLSVIGKHDQCATTPLFLLSPRHDPVSYVPPHPNGPARRNQKKRQTRKNIYK